jgi:hypothetical protein
MPTGMSPNIAMLGREATAPLDISYEMPSSIKPIPIRVWEMREKFCAYLY